jgi:hypothetical protein
MEQLIGVDRTFCSEATRNLLADGLVKYILFHNDKAIRARSYHMSYAPEDITKVVDPYPADKYYNFQDKITKPPVADKKAGKKATPEVKEHKTKFISVSPAIKKWLSTICSRLIHECNQAYPELYVRLQSSEVSDSGLDSAMFAKSYDINLFKLISKIVGNHEYVLKTKMNISVMEEDLVNKIKDRFQQEHPARMYNVRIAGWLAQVIDSFFKILACYISSKNWYDRDATLTEKNFPWILWQLAENTEYESDLEKFIYEMLINFCEEDPVNTSNLITFSMTNLSAKAQEIMNMSPVKKPARSKKAEPNRTVTNLNETPVTITQNPIINQLAGLPAAPLTYPAPPTQPVQQTPQFNFPQLSYPTLQVQQAPQLNYPSQQLNFPTQPQWSLPQIQS